jgi:hypothetical protein
MPLFDLPLSAAVRRSGTSRKYSSDGSSRKRKRKHASSESSSSHDDLHNDDLVVQSTNPLSLTPDEIIQYRLAGLSLNKPLPREKGHFDFPHRGLPADAETQKDFKHDDSGRREKGSVASESGVDDVHSENEVQDEGSTRQPRGYRLRLQHLSVLTAIVHKCLLEGDIKRATRAYSLLIRSEFAGKALDIKSTGYWGIGAELLIRSQEQGKFNKFHRVSDSGSESESEDLGTEGTNEDRDIPVLRNKTWGSTQGLGLAKSYYETLIVQYPFKKQYHGYVSSLDFWPAMAACEICGIQSVHQTELMNNSHRYNHGSPALSDDDSDPDDHFEDAQENFEGSTSGSPTPNIRRRARKHNRLNEIWTERDNIRITALSAAESLGQRMDNTMSRIPFDKNVSMLRLRGMLALYIGDLHVSQRPDELDEEDDDRDERFLFLQRKAEHEQGLARKEAIWGGAKKYFEKCRAEGGPYVDLDLLRQLAGREESVDQDDERSPRESTEELDG